MLVQCFHKLPYFCPQWDSVIFPPKHFVHCSLASLEVLIFIPPSLFPFSKSLYHPLAFSFVFWVPLSLSLSLSRSLSLSLSPLFLSVSRLLPPCCEVLRAVMTALFWLLDPGVVFDWHWAPVYHSWTKNNLRVDQERVTNQRTIFWGYWGLSWAQREWDSITNKPLTILLKKVGGI